MTSILKKISIFCKILILAALGGHLFGQSITISGNPPPLVVSTATAGAQPTTVTNATTTYGVSALGATRTVVGKINTNMPTGVTLRVQLQAPTSATSAGSVAMTTTNRSLVTGITALTSTSGLTITYRLSATVAAAPIANATRTLTLTIQ